MFAVIETGGKQYKVSQGDVLDVDLMQVKAADAITFDKVLLFANDGKVEVGTPYVAGVKVKAKIVDNVKDQKVIAFKFHNKTGYHKIRGHRAQYTRVQIEEIK